MKKRMKQKIKKLLPKISLWLSGISLATFLLFNSIHSYIALHNGASAREVGGRRYAPVVNELLMMIIAGVLLIFGLKYFTKLRLIYIIILGVLIFGMIGLFGFWSFNYTGQDLIEGFMTTIIIIISVTIITCVALMYEAYARRKRNK